MREQSQHGNAPAMPAYRLHKGSGQAIVKIRGKVVYLGRWESAESRNKYEQVVSEWRARGRYLPEGYQGPGSGLGVDDLIAAYWQHNLTVDCQVRRPTVKLWCNVLRPNATSCNNATHR